MLQTAWLLPPRELLTLGFDPARFQTEPPVCYRASWQLLERESHPLATTSLCWITIYTFDLQIWAHPGEVSKIERGSAIIFAAAAGVIAENAKVLMVATQSGPVEIDASGEALEAKDDRPRSCRRSWSPS